MSDPPQRMIDGAPRGFFRSIVEGCHGRVAPLCARTVERRDLKFSWHRKSGIALVQQRAEGNRIERRKHRVDPELALMRRAIAARPLSPRRAPEPFSRRIADRAGEPDAHNRVKYRWSSCVVGFLH
jgi:hypothetical protein